MMAKQTIAQLLAKEAEDARQHRDQPNATMFRSRRPAVDPSQVYSVRMPVNKLEQLRQLAARADMNPSSLMRQWVLERLEEEAAGGRDEKQLRRIIREEVERATQGVARTAAGKP
jgi:uncharacterized protein YdiU (UPF0061 family)